MAESSYLAELAALSPAHEVFPGLTADDLLFAMTLGPCEDLRSGTASYGLDGDPLQKLHWFAPAEPGSYPAVLFLHSGSWAGGEATTYLRYASELARLGYITASADYRVTPLARWPDPLHDVCSAAAWLRDDPLALGVAPSSLVLAGGSAGAHLAAMAALTPVEGVLSHTDVAAAVLWYPPLRLSTVAAVPGNTAAVEALLGSLDPEQMDRASPLERVSASAPPVLTMVGDQDPICPLEEVRAFHAALTDHGVPNDWAVFPDAPHGFDLSRKWYATSFERMHGFLTSRGA